MKQMYKVILVVVTLTFFSCNNENKNTSPTNNKQWVSLFNGKNLDGWTPKINGHKLGTNYKNTFRVEDNILKVSYSKYDTFTDQYGHLFYKTAFTNYRLRLKYRFVGKQVNGGEPWATKNSGIMIHCQAPKTMLLNQGFPVSLEAQLLGGVNKEEERPSGNLCTPGTHVVIDGKKITDHCIPATCKTYYGTEWIIAEIVVNKKSIKHFIDKKLVISYTNPTIGGEYLDSASRNIQAKSGQSLTSGYISLQSESHPIEFKDIEIIEF